MPAFRATGTQVRRVTLRHCPHYRALFLCSSVPPRYNRTRIAVIYLERLAHSLPTRPQDLFKRDRGAEEQSAVVGTVPQGHPPNLCPGRSERWHRPAHSRPICQPDETRPPESRQRSAITSLPHPICKSSAALHPSASPGHRLTAGQSRETHRRSARRSAD
jgi:hypothetical protein